jgi:outer membrane protein TolC
LTSLPRALATCVLVVGCLAAPLAAEPSSPSYITPQQGRSIADPNNLAPPRHGSPATSMAAPPDAPAVSLDLNRAITTVLEKSPTVERVMSRIRQAEYKVEEAYTMANPTVSFTTQYTRVEPGLTVPNIGTINPTDNYQFSLNIRQAIYTFGRMKWTALAAKLQQRVVEEEYRTEINRLVELTAQRYIEALLSQDAVSIALDNLEAQQANLRTSQLLYDQGVAARFDVLSNSAAVARAEQRLLEARTAEANAKARLLSLLDEPLDRSLRLSRSLCRTPSNGPWSRDPICAACAGRWKRPRLGWRWLRPATTRPWSCRTPPSTATPPGSLRALRTPPHWC